MLLPPKMFFQTKMDKKGVSIMIGYVLLVTSAIVMGSIVYQWMKTYVPTDSLECPEGVSIFITNINCAGDNLFVTLKNNGRFNIAGYFIHATNNSKQELATIDLSKYFASISGVKIDNAILFGPSKDNSMKINEVIDERFNLTNQVYSIEIIPIRYQEEKNKIRLVSCGNAKVTELTNCV